MARKTSSRKPVEVDQAAELEVEVARLRRELYAEEERAKHSRATFAIRRAPPYDERDHAVLDAVSAVVEEKRVELRLAELALQQHRARKGR